MFGIEIQLLGSILIHKYLKSFARFGFDFKNMGS